jgi:transketolase
MGFEPLADKWAAFGWHVQRVDGNDLPAVLRAFDLARALKEAKPRVILFDTLMGKGVPFLEQREKNHFIRVDPPEWQQALRCWTQNATRRSHGMSTTVDREEAAPDHLGHDRLHRERRAAREGRAVRQGPGRATRPSRPEVVGLTADLAKVHRPAPVRAGLPRTLLIQMGMAEQLLMGAAGGMAKEGLVPFATTYAVFGTRRAYDFIHQVIAEENLNVKICCALPGLTTGYGPSHQATEDLAMMRGVPGLTIVDPCDALDIEQAVPQIAAHPGPVYMRLLRGQVPLGAGRDRGLPASSWARPSAARRRRRAHHLQRLHDHACAGSRGRPGTGQHRRGRAALPDHQAAGRGRHRRGRPPPHRLVVVAENHSVVGGLGEAVASALLRHRVQPAGSSWRACPMPSSTPGPCPRCTTATASAAQALAGRIKGWLA